MFEVIIIYVDVESVVVLVHVTARSVHVGRGSSQLLSYIRSAYALCVCGGSMILGSMILPERMLTQPAIAANAM